MSFHRFAALAVVVLGAVSISGCQEPAKSASQMIQESTVQPVDKEILEKDFSGEETEPDQITVQHCLIGFRGSVPGKNISRTKLEASELALKILKDARNGADFAELIKEHTDDSPPGIYVMTNSGVGASKPSKFGGSPYSRDGMVPAFGDVGFKLKVDGFGMSEFDAKASPYGWHVIKRIE